ncbi:acylphosphatase [Marinobacter sp. GN3S48]|uniref:acylphosphatase n=1 Tax=Marinobacter sp. GN3S48 TaxID=3382302 RepID=UPI00387B67B9
MMRTRWVIVVSGKVQGVYYRSSTEDVARRLNLTGYAKNLSDGRVEIVAEGLQEDLQALKDWCEEGPPAARVTGVEVREAPVSDEFREFRIKD